MKKNLVILAVALIGGNGWSILGYSRDCMGAVKNYTYSFTVVTAQEGATTCAVTLTSAEKDFINQVLSIYSDNTNVDRRFYVNNIKSKYGSDTTREVALRRVVRDFGGSSKRAGEMRPIRTVGDIRKMLAGQLKDIGTEQAF